MPVKFPRIKSVTAKANKQLLVQFVNGVFKLYDCTPLLANKAFQLLGDDAFFRCARADEHGYGVVWNDEIDLAESEIWLNGQDVAHSPTSKQARQTTL